MKGRKELWKVDIVTEDMSLRTVVTSGNLRDLIFKHSIVGPREKLIFEYIVKEKGFDLPNLKSISIEPISLTKQTT